MRGASESTLSSPQGQQALGPPPETARHALRTLAVLALVACGGDRRDRPAPAAATGASCTAAIAAAASQPMHARTAAIVRGCPVCGPSFEPFLGAIHGYPDLAASVALVNACELGCSRRAIGRWRALLGDVVPGSGSARPWRALGEDCPAAMATTEETARWASPSWLALTLIGARVKAAAPGAPTAPVDGVTIALPPWSVVGTGLAVAPGRASDALPWRAVTLTDAGMFAARLPRGRLGPDGWTVDVDPAPYPGTAITDGAGALAATGAAPALPGRTDDLVLLAPRGMAAGKAFAALRALAPTPVRFAVAVDDPAWPGAIGAHALALASLTGPRLRLDLRAARLGAIGPDGAVLAWTNWPTADDRAAAPTTSPRQAALAIARGRAVELVDAVPDDLDVAGLVAVLDELAAAGATGAALAPAGTAVLGPGDAVDLAAVDAALAKAPQP